MTIRPVVAGDSNLSDQNRLIKAGHSYLPVPLIFLVMGILMWMLFGASVKIEM